MSAPTRIVILQRPGQPLEPVATRLRAWGCAVRSFGGSLEMISTLSRLDTDVVMVDAGSKPSREPAASADQQTERRLSGACSEWVTGLLVTPAEPA
jgi:hypothetical protein